jgi:hypothetical protein
MSYYNVNAIRLDASHHVTHVQWERLNSPYPMDYQFTEATVLEVVKALNQGNDVFLVIEFPEYSVQHKGEFRTISYPDGTEGIYFDGFALTDLPTC